MNPQDDIYQRVLRIFDRSSIRLIRKGGYWSDILAYGEVAPHQLRPSDIETLRELWSVGAFGAAKWYDRSTRVKSDHRVFFVKLNDDDGNQHVVLVDPAGTDYARYARALSPALVELISKSKQPLGDVEVGVNDSVNRLATRLLNALFEK